MTTRRIGSLRLLVLGLLALGAGAGRLPAQQKAAYSVIAGTVFREPGFALPGAVVTLEAAETPAKGKRFKPQKVVSDRHGEYGFRLSPTEAKFKLTAAAKGFVPQEKETTASPGVRVDVFFELKPESR
ncbi:MAG: carboxypeptidase-like regulatory domain-containing protein [Acidobacteriota bacterium]|jgi:hypothetical protein